MYGGGAGERQCCPRAVVIGEPNQFGPGKGTGRGGEQCGYWLCAGREQGRPPASMLLMSSQSLVRRGEAVLFLTNYWGNNREETATYLSFFPTL